MKRILVACEESQSITIEFRKLGFDAFSCDLLPCSGGKPEWHIQHDVTDVLNGGGYFLNQKGQWLEFDKWDAIIAFPPCTRLTVAANKYYKPEYKKRFPNIHNERIEAINFFMLFAKCDIKFKAIENPIGVMSSNYRKPDQIIQPYQFGHTERKATCLWLYGLPKLKATNIVEPNIIFHKSGRTDSKLHFDTLKLPKDLRAKLRSKTFPGIAKAMAEQWGEFLLTGINKYDKQLSMF